LRLGHVRKKVKLIKEWNPLEIKRNPKLEFGKKIYQVLIKAVSWEKGNMPT